MAKGGLTTITVFGGTGFLGRRVVKHVLDRGFPVRIATRHPDRVRELFRSEATPPEAVEADIMDASALAAAVSGSGSVVNAVSLYVEKGEETFERVHVRAAADLASAAQTEGVRQFIQISGIGSDARSESPYIRARGRGEEAVRNAFPRTTIVRPAVMTGPDDAFLTMLVKLVRTLPVYPMFGRGETRLQPAYVGDVAEGIGKLIEKGELDSQRVFEFGGPEVYTYEELLRELAHLLDTKVRLLPVPYAAWYVLAAVGERLPLIPITRNQVDLMRHDNVASPDKPGLAELGVDRTEMEEVVNIIRKAGS